MDAENTAVVDVAVGRGAPTANTNPDRHYPERPYPACGRYCRVLDPWNGLHGENFVGLDAAPHCASCPCRWWVHLQPYRKAA